MAWDNVSQVTQGWCRGLTGGPDIANVCVGASCHDDEMALPGDHSIALCRLILQSPQRNSDTQIVLGSGCSRRTPHARAFRRPPALTMSAAGVSSHWGVKPPIPKY
jgi:hypothetical protein